MSENRGFGCFGGCGFNWEWILIIIVIILIFCPGIFGGFGDKC